MARPKRQWIALQIAALLLFVGAFLVVQPHLAKAVGVNASSISGMSGDGTYLYPYEITTCQNLQDINQDLDAVFVLNNDIDCSDTINWNSGAGFTPIAADGNNSFTGTLDGRGHTISSLYINQPSNTQYVGLFGYAYGNAHLLNFKLANTTINVTPSDYSKIGGVVGQFYYATGTVSSVSFEGAVNVTGCSNTVYIGGIAGYINGSQTIFDRNTSSGNLTVSGTNCGTYDATAGGLIGSGLYTKITNSYSTANITFDGEATADCLNNCRNIGGLVGEFYGESSIKNSYASGTLTVTGDNGPYLHFGAGGLTGSITGGNLGLENNISATPMNVPSPCGINLCDEGPGLVGAITSYLGGGGSWTNNYFDYTALGLGIGMPCVGSDLFNPNCTGINSDGSQSGYFENNTSNAPLSSWDFSDIWQTTNGLPELQANSNPAPAAPTGVTIVPVTTSSLNVLWDQTADPNDTFAVYYHRVGGDSGWTKWTSGITQNYSNLYNLTTGEYDITVVTVDAHGYFSTSTGATGGTQPNVGNGMQGSGSAADPYQVSTCQNLQDINMSYGQNYSYVLTQDIDCSDTVNWNNGAGFKPIGMYNIRFAGSLNGQGHTISNLYIDQTNDPFHDNWATGVFASTENTARFLNFTLDNLTVHGGIGPTGGLIGYNYPNNSNNLVISQVHVNGTVTTVTCLGSPSIGGLIGTGGYARIDASSTTGEIVVNGGANCSKYQDVAGGIAGSLYHSSITGSYSSANVTFIGDATESCDPTETCRALGGLVGSLSTDNQIDRSYASGTLTVVDNGNDINYAAGGLVGDQAYNSPGIATITNSFTAVTMDLPVLANRAGGLIGNDNGFAPGDTLTNNYYDATKLDIGANPPCIGSDAGTTWCIAVNGDGSQPNYFKNNSNNTPLNDWNFSNPLGVNNSLARWQTTNEYPVLISNNNPIAAPTGLAAEIVSGSQIDLHWNASPGNGNIYTITYRATGTLTWQSTTVEADAVKSITGLTGDTQYDFRVSVTNSDGYTSLPSDIIVARTARPNYTLISSCTDLQNMDNDLEKRYELAHDIDCSDTVNWNGGQGFDPIGTFNPFTDTIVPFFGTLIGNNYKISNLYINRPSEASGGLFNLMFNGTVQDLTLDSPVINNAILTSGSLAGLVGNSTITNVHVENASIGGSPLIAAGFIGAASTLASPSTDTVTISKSSVTGAINTTGPMANVAGFVAASNGTIDFQNNYSNMQITTESVSQGGGFVGILQVRDASVISKNYAAGSYAVTSSDTNLNQPSPLNPAIPDTFSVLGGFGGMYVDDQGAYDSQPATITNNFDHVALSSASSEGVLGGLFTVSLNPTIDLTTNYFDADQAGIATCVNPLAGSSACGAISGQPNYFKNNATNPPLNTWDFTNIWKTTSEFPEFDEDVLTTPSTVIPPVGGSGSGTCYTLFGANVCPTPSTPTVTPGTQQAVAAAITAETKGTGTATASGPTDEQGVLGAIKHFVRSLPPVVVAAFPYALFLLLGLAAVILLIELVRELRRLHILQALIHKQRLLAEERDAFWHLAANYLRAPVTLIVGGAEALNDVKSTTVTKELGTIATALQSKIAEIMKKIEGSTSLQAISQAAPRPVARTAKRAVFIIPVVTVAAFAILGNYAAASFRGMNAGATGYLVQAALFIIVAVIFYWTLGLLSRGKSKRQAAEAQLERQTGELANARHELINDTAKQINPDLTKLEKIFATLPATQATLEPAKTLHEGASRLREIVSSFSMLIKVQEGTGMANATAPKTLDLSTALNKVRAKLTPQITAKGVRVVAPAVPLAISAEADMANQVLESIIANAVDYSPANGTVKVEARRLQDKIQLRISDQGKGIDKKQLDHLFQPFVRTDGTSAMDMSHGGFGINLYLDKLIMEQLGGSISAASAVGKGTAITMEWPV